MSEQSQTNIKFQRELENLLPDNNAKEISAADVRSIVTSNYQPQMIWSGFFDSTNTTGGSVYRTSYANPNYFRNLWVLTDPGAGLTPGSYTNQVLSPDNSYLSYNFANNGGNSGGAVFNLEVSATGVVSSFTVVENGYGWIGEGWTNGFPSSTGQTGTFSLAGASTQPVMKYVGPMYFAVDTKRDIYAQLSVNSINNNFEDHTKVNTMIASSSLPIPNFNLNGWISSGNNIGMVATNQIQILNNTWVYNSQNSTQTGYSQQAASIWRIAQ